MFNNNFSFHTNVKHQETVQILGTQNLYLRVVYAHIDNYTQVKGGWCGSQRDLAAQLEMPVGTINNQLNELLRRGLIVLQGNTYRSTREHSCSADELSREQRRSADEPSREQRRSAGEQRRSVEEQKCSANEQKCPAGEPPITPNIKEIKKERENNIARETIATQAPTPSSSFECFVELYKGRTGKSKVDEEDLSAAKGAWDVLTAGQQAVLLNELQKPGSEKIKNKLSWTITDYKFARPRKMDGELDADRLYKEGKLCSALPPGESEYATYIYEEALQAGYEIKQWLDPMRRA